MLEGQFVALSNGQVLARNPKTGDVIWSGRVGPEDVSGGNEGGVLIGDRVYVNGISHFAAYASDGTELWKVDQDLTLGTPVWIGEDQMVSIAGNRIMRFELKPLPPLPTDPAERKAMAAVLAADYALLDNGQKARLKELGREAFEQVLNAYLAEMEAADSVYDSDGLDELLMEIAGPEHTQTILDLFRAGKVDEDAQPTLLTVLAQHGDEKLTIPLFLSQLQGETPGFEFYQSNTYIAREVVAGSSHPDAVAFMLEKLNNPEADPVLRETAYHTLARTGGEAGAKAVLAHRRERKLLAPLADRMGLDDMAEPGQRRRSYSSILKRQTGPDGREWGLIESSVLANHTDLWLVEYKDGKWQNPLFTGVNTSGITRWASEANLTEPTLGGKTGKELADSQDWLTILLAADLAKDSDGDGLTDIVEKRLTTDPNNPDTDGDGDRDEIDPMPNAKNRATSTDAEKALAAAYEARYHDYDEVRRPALLDLPEGMEPFELVGWGGPVIVRQNATKETTWRHPLAQNYEYGITMLDFRAMSEDGSLLAWNEDRTIASVRISTYSGGLSGDGYLIQVQKFGDEWLPIYVRMEYVS